MSQNELNVRITANADGVKKGVKEATEHLDLASESISLLGNLIGEEIPAGVQKALAAIDLVGPALNAAFIPLQVIVFMKSLEELRTRLEGVIRGNSDEWLELSQTVFDFHQDAQIKLLQV